MNQDMNPFNTTTPDSPDELSFPDTEQNIVEPTHTVQPNFQKGTSTIQRKTLLAGIIPSLIAILLVASFIGWRIMTSQNSEQVAQNNTDPSTNVNLSGLDLSVEKLTEANQLEFNGKIIANQGLVLGVQSEPTNPQTGQIYYDQTLNVVRIYDGSNFKDLNSPNEQSEVVVGARGPAGVNGTNGVAGAPGVNGVNGVNGSNGATGPTGPAGPSGTATCPNGPCLSLQPTASGVVESGNINISGSVNLAGSLLARNSTNSTNAFDIQNAAGTSLFRVDTSTNPNLISNPSFETNTTGWSALGGATISQSTSYSMHGIASLRIDTTATVGDGVRFDYLFNPNTTYSLSYKIKSTTTSTWTLNFGHSDNGSDVNCSEYSSSFAPEWLSLRCTFTTSATISSSSYIYLKQNDATVKNLYIDAVQLELGQITTPYNIGGTIALGAVVTGNTRFSGNLQIGETVSDYGAVLTVGKTYTDFGGIESDTYYEGINQSYIVNPITTSPWGSFYANDLYVSIPSSNDKNLYGMYGQFTSVYHGGSGTLNTINAQSSYADNAGGGTVNTLQGLRGQANNSGGSTVSSTAAGVIGRVDNYDASFINSAYALYGAVRNYDTSTINTTWGLLIDGVTNASGTVTNNYGIQVRNVTAGTNDYGIAVSAAGTQTLWLSTDANNTTSSAGIAFGSSRDTNLYRSAANVLRTDDAFSVGTLGTTDTSTYLCRNTVNILSGCLVSPLNSNLSDNTTNSLDIQEGSNNYININTTNSSENISFGNTFTNPSYNFLGSGTLAVVGAQTIGGNLTVDTNTLFVDAANNRVGIGTNTPTATLDIVAPTPTVIGGELVTNGSFTGSATGWTLQSNCSEYGTNNVVVTYDATCQGDADYPAITTNITVNAGSTYKISFTLSGVSGDTVYIYNNDESGTSLPYVDGTHTQYFTAKNSGTVEMSFISSNYYINGTWTIDNVSVVEVNQSLSVINITSADGERVLNLGNVGTKNIAIGTNALINNTTGQANVANGYYALYSNTTGFANTATGSRVLYSNTSGWSNNGIGSVALENNTTGFLNNAFGNSSLRYNTTGTSNNVIGSAAFLANTTGTGNSAIGRNVGFSNLTGSNNVYLGRDAAYGVYGGVDNSSNNVFLGYRSGYVVDDADNNILIGYQAGDNLTDGDNNIIIGYNLDASSATVSNELRIGGILQGSTSTLAAQFNGTLDVSGSTRVRGSSNTVLTGSINPIASTTLTGVGTLFLSELQVGDRITVSGETRTVTAIASNTSLTVDVPTTDTANDTSPDRLPAALIVKNSSNVNTLVISDIGSATFQNSTDSAQAFSVRTSSGVSVLSVNTLNLRVDIASGADIKLAGSGNVRNAITKDFVCTVTEAVNDVVVINGVATVGRTTTAASNRVAGVVVEKPNSTTCTVAIAGMVQVNFGANANPVTVGDPVETSAIAGMAQATATPSVGAVLGNTTSNKDGSNLVWILMRGN